MAESRIVDLDYEAERVITLQNRGARALWLAFLLATATVLFVTFFQYGDWRQEALRWTQEEDKPAIAEHIISGEFRGISWRGWAAIGAAGTGVMCLLGVASLASANRRLASTPGLTRAVREERQRQLTVRLIIFGVLFFFIVIPILIIAAVAAGGGSGGNDDD